MGKIAFASDIHLNVCNSNRIEDFCNSLLVHQPSHIVIAGDISEADTVGDDLDQMEKYCNGTPILFVLGNHDFYNGSISRVRQEMIEDRNLSWFGQGKIAHANSFWLGSAPFLKLSEETYIVGHDGFYDGGYSNWFASKLDMIDYHIIHELCPKTCLTREDTYNKLQLLAKESAEHITHGVEAAIKDGAKKVFVVTHVPPFKQNSTFRGKISDDTWLPHFSSAIMGDALLGLAYSNPEIEFQVLCGHSHGRASYQAAKNMNCLTAEASYKRPKLECCFDF